MKTKISIQLLFSILGTLAYNITLSQVGIDTPTPLGALHIDGAKNNPSTGIPNSTQTIDDFIVKSTGNVGIGTITPTAKIEINSGTPNTSGVRLTQITTSLQNTPVNTKAGILGVDNTGNVIISKLYDPSIPPCVQTFAFIYDDTEGNSGVIAEGDKENTLSKKMDPKNIFSGGNFSLKAGNTYRLEASFFNNYTDSNQVVAFSYEWYNETDNISLPVQNVPRATVFQNSTSDFTGIQPYLLAFITPTKDIQVSIRFRKVEGTNQTYTLRHSYMQIQQINPCETN
ncbi:hypothetical protein ACQ7CU_04570 [Chryseobacterium arthrosphaerae]|uniref:hypothetical protein n=1 Tax=Chryseobacterium arthrosphaerae TaxID=651561 RepID=UPI003D33B7B8